MKFRFVAAFISPRQSEKDEGWVYMRWYGEKSVLQLFVINKSRQNNPQVYHMQIYLRIDRSNYCVRMIQLFLLSAKCYQYYMQRQRQQHKASLPFSEQLNLIHEISESTRSSSILTLSSSQPIDLPTNEQIESEIQSLLRQKREYQSSNFTTFLNKDIELTFKLNTIQITSKHPICVSQTNPTLAVKQLQTRILQYQELHLQLRKENEYLLSQINIKTTTIQEQNKIIQELQQCLADKSKLVTRLLSQPPNIKQIPVYIEKQILLQVAVPIYINQKREQRNYNLLNINDIFQEENSIAINQLSAEIEQSDANSDTKKSNFKFGQNCKSLQYSQIQDDKVSNHQSKISNHQSKVEHQISALREKRVKQIVQVPVYIQREVVKEVQKIIREQVIVKQQVIVRQEVIVQKQVIKYIMVNESQQPQRSRFYSEKSMLSAFEDFAQIEEESMESKQSKASFKEDKYSSNIQQKRDKSDSSKSEDVKEIIIEIPVQVEKQVIVFREVLIPIEVPIEIIVEKEILVEKQVVIEKEVLVEKQVIVEKQVPIEKIIERIILHEAFNTNPQPHHNPTIMQKRAPILTQQKLPQQLIVQFLLQNNLYIQKILVTQKTPSLQFLQPDAVDVKQFIPYDHYHSPPIMEIVQFPIQIYLKPDKKEMVEVGIQTCDEAQKQVNNPPMEIIVQKVIYVYEQEQEKGGDESFITLGKPKHIHNQQRKTYKNNYSKAAQQNQIIFERTVQKLVQVEKIVEKIQLQAVFMQIPTEIIIERPIEIVKEKQIIKEVEVLKQIEVIKEVIREVIVYVEASKQVEGNREQIPSAQQNFMYQQFQLSPQAKEGLNVCVPLTDRSDQSANERSQPPSRQYQSLQPLQNLKIRQQNQQFPQNSQRYKRWEEQLRCTQNVLLQLGQQKQSILTQNKELKTYIKNLQEVIESNNQTISQNIFLQEHKEKEIIKMSEARQLLEEILQDKQRLIDTLRAELSHSNSTIFLLQTKLKQAETAQSSQYNQLTQQILYKDKEIQDLTKIVQQIQQQLKNIKQQQYRLQQNKSELQSQIIALRSTIQQNKQTFYQTKQSLQSQLLLSMKQQEQLRGQYEQKISTVQLLYKRQIQDIVNQNNQCIQAKDSQISELFQTIKSTPKSRNQRNNQKINVKIINLQNQPSKSREQQLFDENQRFLQVIQNLNEQIAKLSEEISFLQEEVSKNTSGHLQTRSKIKSFHFNQFQFQQNPKKKPTKAKVRIQELSNIAKGFNKPQSFNRAPQLNQKDQQIQSFKQLIKAYEQTIQSLQYELQTYHQQQYQNYSYIPAQSHIIDEYSHNLLKKISLLDQHVRFEKTQKLKLNARLRQYQRIIDQYSYHMMYNESDTQLLQKLTFQLQQQKIKNSILKRQNQKIKVQMHSQQHSLNQLLSQINHSKNDALLDDLEGIDRRIEGEFGYELSTLKKYQSYKIRYVKFLQLSQLIKEEISILQEKVPRSCEDSIKKIKRFLMIIEKNQGNANISTSKNAWKHQRHPRHRDQAIKPQNQDEFDFLSIPL